MQVFATVANQAIYMNLYQNLKCVCKCTIGKHVRSTSLGGQDWATLSLINELFWCDGCFDTHFIKLDNLSMLEYEYEKRLWGFR